MMTSMAQPLTTHPGMPGHAGIAHGGQPMVHGHPSNQGVPGGGQPGVSMGQQIHPGMAGPGGPQVSQAVPMMPGMMQAGGPPGVSGGGVSAHAMGHLTPHQSQMYNQQQMSKSYISFHFKGIAQEVNDCVLRLSLSPNYETGNNNVPSLQSAPSIISREDDFPRLIPFERPVLS